MINHVNTVLVSNDKSLALLSTADTLKTGLATAAAVKALKGQLVTLDVDSNALTITDATKRFKIGMLDGTSYAKDGKYVPNVRWSNIIQTSAIMSVNAGEFKANTPEQVDIDFTGVMAKAPFSEGNVSMTLRIQYKDMPTRYRQWSESYNYLIEGTESDAELAEAFAKMINKEVRRQRVSAVASEGKLTLKGLEYDDPKVFDQGYDNMVRFNAVVYYANPQADGITFHNKYQVPFTNEIKKTEGERYAADAVIVRTREIEAWDYMGVLHRCCWYDPTPAVETDLSKQYDYLVIEFENEYHAADDIRRHTKEAVEIYAETGSTGLAAIKTALGLD